MGLLFYIHFYVGVNAGLLPDGLLYSGLELGLEIIVGLFLLLGAFLHIVVEDMPQVAENVFHGHFIVFQGFQAVHRLFVGPASSIIPG